MPSCRSSVVVPPPPPPTGGGGSSDSDGSAALMREAVGLKPAYSRTKITTSASQIVGDSQSLDKFKNNTTARTAHVGIFGGVVHP
jgi:hypothetical protein